MKTLNNPFLRSLSLAAVIALGTCQSTHATEYFWDTTATTGYQAASGTWGTSNWSTNGARELHRVLVATFRENLASRKPIHASSTWQSCRGYDAQNATDEDPLTYWSAAASDTSAYLEIDLGQPVRFNLIALQEPVFMGQRVKQYLVDYYDGAEWQVFSQGTTIGYRKLDLRPAVSAQKVRLHIMDARAYPLLSTFGIYMSPFQNQGNVRKKSGTREEGAI